MFRLRVSQKRGRDSESEEEDAVEQYNTVKERFRTFPASGKFHSPLRRYILAMCGFRHIASSWRGLYAYPRCVACPSNLTLEQCEEIITDPESNLSGYHAGFCAFNDKTCPNCGLDFQNWSEWRGHMLVFHVAPAMLEDEKQTMAKADDAIDTQSNASKETNTLAVRRRRRKRRDMQDELAMPKDIRTTSIQSSSATTELSLAEPITVASIQPSQTVVAVASYDRATHKIIVSSAEEINTASDYPCLTATAMVRKLKSLVHQSTAPIVASETGHLWTFFAWMSEGEYQTLQELVELLNSM